MSITPQTPTLILTDLTAYFRVSHDPLGYRIEIGQDFYARPDSRGTIKSWSHAEGVNPEGARRDIELLRALIRHVFQPWERHVFQSVHSDRRQTALEAICDAANDIRHAGEESDWIGREQ